MVCKREQTSSRHLAIEPDYHLGHEQKQQQENFGTVSQQGFEQSHPFQRSVNYLHHQTIPLLPQRRGFSIDTILQNVSCSLSTLCLLSILAWLIPNR